MPTTKVPYTHPQVVNPDGHPQGTGTAAKTASWNDITSGQALQDWVSNIQEHYDATGTPWLQSPVGTNAVNTGPQQWNGGNIYNYDTNNLPAAFTDQWYDYWTNPDGGNLELRSADQAYGPNFNIPWMMEIINSLGGFYDPSTAFGNYQNFTGPELGQAMFNKGLSNFNLTDIGGPDLLNPFIRDAGAPAVDLGTIGQVMDMFAGVGREAAGMIPAQEVTDLAGWNQQLRDATPFWNGQGGVLDTIQPVMDTFRQDAEAGYGALGIPSEQIAMLQEAGIRQAGAAEQAMGRMMDDRFNMSGQLGQGAQMSALMNEAYPALADLRYQAATQPWLQSYELGQGLMSQFNDVGQTDQAFAQMAQGGTLADLQRQLDAGVARANVFGELAGQGGAVGANVAMSDADNALRASMANQSTDLGQYQSLLSQVAPQAFSAPWMGINAQQQAGQYQNQLNMGMLEQAINFFLNNRAAQANFDQVKNQQGSAASAIAGGALPAIATLGAAAIGGPAGAVAGAGLGAAAGAAGGAAGGGGGGMVSNPRTGYNVPSGNFSLTSREAPVSAQDYASLLGPQALDATARYAPTDIETLLAMLQGGVNPFAGSTDFMELY